MIEILAGRILVDQRRWVSAVVVRDRVDPLRNLLRTRQLLCITRFLHALPHLFTDFLLFLLALHCRLLIDGPPHPQHPLRLVPLVSLCPLSMRFVNLIPNLRVRATLQQPPSRLFISPFCSGVQRCTFSPRSSRLCWRGDALCEPVNVTAILEKIGHQGDAVWYVSLCGSVHGRTA